jgi:ribosomal peptide maturation radical SAM protein 1
VADEQVDVVLVTMPYGNIHRPSIALGLLKASLDGTGISCAVEYANLRFAELVGLDVTGLMYFTRTDSLIGEWTFASAAFPDHRTTAEDILGKAALHQAPNLPATAVRDHDFAGVFEHVRSLAARFVDETARRILARRPRIVGCTSTFEQQTPSLALLRRIKALDPSVVTMLGGANCEAEMGWAVIREFPWVDYVVSGEAEGLFPTLCRLALDRGADAPIAELPAGVLGAEHARAGTYETGRAEPPRAVVERLDTSPMPDYTDYFAALARSPLREAITPALVVETSRGCWWGQKSQCTFCGLNGTGMAYRSKSPARVLAELDAQTARYDIRRFEVADNILDMTHLRTVLPELARRGGPYRFFYETKANLRRDQVATMAAAGVTRMQPGIEALHDDLLRLMAKGNSTAINVQVLKYAREFGMFCNWYLLVDFPGEDPRWHEEVAGWLPLLYHLQPAGAVVHIRFDRFSVYHAQPERYGLRLAPYPTYSSVYPLPPERLMDLAYFFVDAGDPEPGRVAPGAAALAARVGEWKALFQRDVKPVLCMTVEGGAVHVLDTRPCAVVRRVTLEGVDTDVYLACDPAVGQAELLKRVARPADAARTVEAVRAAIARLCELKLLLHVHGKYLALAVGGDLPIIPDPEEFPGGYFEKFDRRTSATLEEAWAKLKRLGGVAPGAVPAELPA